MDNDNHSHSWLDGSVKQVFDFDGGIMAIGFKYDSEKKVLYITLEGEVLLKELDQLYRDIVTSTEFPPDIRSVWDLRKADLSLIDLNFIEKIFYVRKKYPERSNAKAAFVADSDLSYGVSRMYEVLSSFEFPQQIQPFREFSKAEEWILTEKLN